MRMPAVATFVVVILHAPPLQAEGDEAAMRLTLGLGAPTGLAGLSGEWRLGRASIEGGAGLGRAGPQGAITARFRPGGARFVVSGGASAGDHRVGHYFCFGEGCSYEDILTVWVNADVGAEFRGESWFSFLFAGAGVVANRRHFRDEQGGHHANMADGLWMPYVGFSVGRFL